MWKLGLLRGLPRWRRDAAWRIGYLDRYEGNGLFWLLAGWADRSWPGSWRARRRRRRIAERARRRNRTRG
jgi:hypothetical protein